ncbi:Uncharacterised protein [Sebaldella termitidis]|uniref:Uncharacterized protein n=1 Tax=Sebaldella termitidis (strain ATCC 33386 / NCTC 11300) TaxID=526218 RepID=D1AKK9_SEBTE|nr:hypothetical protein [Sebaldella termitidis]ACZ09125.1 hypothetical protein Sterm_2271 [Sebaldella termitidis ATCC 33386]SUI24443.1 Uncharacterised protein [Sebaldella termitidis]
MKKYFLIAMCFLFTMTYSKQFLTVEDVRAEYELIQKDMPKYEKVAVPDNGNSTEGGEAVYYYENKRLKVIVAGYFGETGKMHEEIYFGDNYPIFVYKERHTYNAPITDKKFNEKRTKIHKERYYFDSNKNLIRYIDEKGKIIVSGDKLQNESINIKNEIVRLLRLRNTKK